MEDHEYNHSDYLTISKISTNNSIDQLNSEVDSTTNFLKGEQEKNKIEWNNNEYNTKASEK